MECLAVVSTAMDKVVAPDVVAAFGPQADA